MRIRTTAATLGVVALAATAAAAPPTVGAPTGTIVGDATEVTGTIAFPEAGRQCLSDANRAFPTAFAHADVADALGLDLVDACLEPLEDGLKFTWVMGTALPEQVPPEGVRYNWAFATSDGQTIQLQAKRSNVASITTAEDPVGHAQHLSQGDVGWFQVRGACTEAYLGAPISGCYHLDFVEGGFDVAAGEAWMVLPFDPHDDLNRPYAPLFGPGATITEVQSAGMSIAASGQAVVSNTTISQFLNGWGSYTLGETVRVGVGSGGANASAWAPATVADGTYAGTVEAIGSHVYAEACQGLLCERVKAPTS